MAHQSKSPAASPSPSGPTASRNSIRILLRCYGYLRPYWKLMAGAYIALLAMTCLNMVVPQLIRITIDKGIKECNVSLIGWLVAGFLGLVIFKGIVTFFQGRWTEIASQGVTYDIRNALLRKLSLLSFSYHDKVESGQLLSRAIQDVDRIRFLAGRATIRLLDSVVLFVVTAVVLCTMHPLLALLSMATLPFLAHRMYWFSRRQRPLSLEIQQKLAVLTTRVEQNLRGMRVVKAFAQEHAEIERFSRENTEWLSHSVASARLQAVNAPLMTLIANLSTVLIILYGGWLVIDNQLTLGSLVAFLTYLGQVTEPVRRLGMIIPNIATAAAAGERVFEILDVQSEVKEKSDAHALPPVTGRVIFEKVSFAYFGRVKTLQDVSFEALPGTITALLGTTGSGKSTVINLIPRFYDAHAGRVTIDGHDVRDVSLSSLRNQIGIVLQESTLFSATIRENIAFGKPDATPGEIIEAAKAAQAHEFIEAMPGGYEATVGERGVTLSGGQRQRVAIARALLKDPRILILDDALSSVDTETERLIQKALERLMQGRTSFVIAQRLSTMRAAHQILLLDKGRISARGTHDELLRSSELYTEIYHRQLNRSGAAA